MSALVWELAAGLDLVAHQRRDRHGGVGLLAVLDPHPEEGADLRIKRGLPQLLGVHFAQGRPTGPNGSPSGDVVVGDVRSEPRCHPSPAPFGATLGYALRAGSIFGTKMWGRVREISFRASFFRGKLNLDAM